MNNRLILSDIELSLSKPLNQISLVSLGGTCTFWNNVISHSNSWKYVLQNDFGIQHSDLFKRKLSHNAKDIVKSLCHLDKMISKFPDSYRGVYSFFKKNSRSSLMILCLDDNAEVFRKEIESSKVELNINAWLDFACAYGAESLAKLLLSLPQARKPDKITLKLAAGSGNKSLCEYLISQKNGIAQLDEIILKFANQSNSTELISYMTSIINKGTPFELRK